MSNCSSLPAIRIKYNKELLEEICERDKCIVDIDKIENFTRDTRINFICNCGIINEKNFRELYKKGGGFCKKCTLVLQKEKTKITSLDRYGVEHILQNTDIREKGKLTCLKKYNVEYSSQNADVKEKGRETCLEKYGYKYPLQNDEIKKLKIKKCLEKYGVENTFQLQEVREKSKQTCLQKYGHEFPQQNADFYENSLKNFYKLKDFTFPCGNIIKVQGYEPLLLKHLVELNYTYEDIIIDRTKVPQIWYKKDNKKHRYYCDAYIPKINTIYEVKSIWTYEKNKEDTLLKKQACIDAGYLYELFIFNKGIRIYL